MAQSNKAPVSPAVKVPGFQVPEGYEKRTGDVVGFVEMGELGNKVHGIPRAAKLSDSKIEPQKPSGFVIFELLEPATVYEGTGDDAVEFPAEKGAMVGVWIKPGMKAILKACGRPVVMVNTGEKRLKGRPTAQSPMKTYDVFVGPGTDQTIPVIDDTREKSAGVATFLSPKRGNAPQGQRQPGDDADGDFGF